jgi:hypothetical protein
LLEVLPTFGYAGAEFHELRMPDDFVYTVNQVAIILNKSDKTVRSYAAEGLLETTKRIEDGSGIEKVFISASSIADLVERKKLALNFAALEEYTPDRHLLDRTFQHTRLHTVGTGEESSPTPSNVLPTPAEETPVVAFLREQLGKLEVEKEGLKQDLKEKDRQLEEKNSTLIAAIRESNDKYQLIALTKEQMEARLAKLVEHTRILHLSTNRDIRRLQAGKLQAGDLSPLPLPSEVRMGEYETEAPPTRKQDHGERGDEGIVVEVSPEGYVPPPSSPEQAETTPAVAEITADSLSVEPRKGRRAKKRRKMPPLPEKKVEKEKPAVKKRGFFSRLFGG